MKKVIKMSVTDQVVDILKDNIISGKYKIGEKLSSEIELCSSLNVSRSSVREAFRILQTQGFIEMKPGRGAFLKSTREVEVDNIREWFIDNAPKLSDFIEVRLAIETLAIKIAATKRTEEQIEELDATRIGIEKAIENDHTQEISRLDELFHKQIVQMTENSLLLKIHDLVSLEFRNYRDVSFNVRHNALNAIEPHRHIADAIRKKDVDAAVKSLEDHLQLVKDDINWVIEK